MAKKEKHKIRITPGLINGKHYRSGLNSFQFRRLIANNDGYSEAFTEDQEALYIVRNSDAKIKECLDTREALGVTKIAPVIYVSSRLKIKKHTATWLRLRGKHNIVSTWMDYTKPGSRITTKAGLRQLWDVMLNEISVCDILVLRVGKNSIPFNGALIEVGAALQQKKRVNIVLDPGFEINPLTMEPFGTWANHSSVRFFTNLEDAMRL